MIERFIDSLMETEGGSVLCVCLLAGGVIMDGAGGKGRVGVCVCARAKLFNIIVITNSNKEGKDPE